MTIAHLVIGGRVAGGQVVALRLARAARTRGHRCVFLSPDDGPFTELVRADGFDVELVDVTRTFRLRGLVRLVSLLRSIRADVLHTHTQLAPNILGRVAGRLAGAKVISHLHIENYFRPQPLGRFVHRTLDNATARLCARIVAVSEDTRRALVEQGYPAERVEVVYNGIDVAQTPEVEPDDGLVVEVARLAEVKGQRTLIQALVDVPRARAMLVGEDLERGGAYGAELEDEARRLGVGDRIELTGYREDASELMSRATVVVLPSTTEGLPIVLLEAMARARPVVATPVGGVPELVADGQTGLLVPPGEPAALAAALRRVLDDPAFARGLGAAGQAHVRDRFSAEAQERRILELYEEVT